MTFGGERLSVDEARSCGDDTATNFADYQCQGLTVIECFGAYGGNAYYFDSDGTLVAVRAAADSYQYCAAWGDTGTTDVWFGDVPPEACR